MERSRRGEGGLCSFFNGLDGGFVVKMKLLSGKGKRESCADLMADVCVEPIIHGVLMSVRRG